MYDITSIMVVGCENNRLGLRYAFDPGPFGGSNLTIACCILLSVV
jgi:hypothetical protein